MCEGLDACRPRLALDRKGFGKCNRGPFLAEMPPKWDNLEKHARNGTTFLPNYLTGIGTWNVFSN